MLLIQIMINRLFVFYNWAYTNSITVPNRRKFYVRIRVAIFFFVFFMRFYTNLNIAHVFVCVFQQFICLRQRYYLTTIVTTQQKEKNALNIFYIAAHA